MFDKNNKTTCNSCFKSNFKPCNTTLPNRNWIGLGGDFSDGVELPMMPSTTIIDWEELQIQLEECMKWHASELSTLHRKCAQSKRSQTLVEDDSQEYKLGTSQTLQELCWASDRIASLEQQLEKY
jgi:hypothetical protein